MASDDSRSRGVRRAVGILILFAGPPAAGVVGLEQLRARPLLTVALILLYEIALAAVSFTAAVSQDLNSRWVPRVAGSIDTWIRLHTSRFTRRYLRYVKASNRYMDVKGLSTVGEHTLEMTDVLITLSLVSTPVHALSPDPVRQRSGTAVDSDKTVWYWLRRAVQDRCVLCIAGPPGSGKTTLLRHVAYKLAGGKGGGYLSLNGPRKIPVLVNLRYYQSWPLEEGFKLADLLSRSLGGPGQNAPAGWVEMNLRRGNFAILLDGLDEIPDAYVRRAVTDWVEEQSNSHSKNLIVLTSRPFGYRDNPVGGATVVEVQPLTEQQISFFIRQWYTAVSVRSHGENNESSRLAARTGATELVARLDESPALFELTTNPLLLTMVANVHKYRGALPGSRTELYEGICDVFLGKRHQARGVAVDMPSRQRKTVLRSLAYTMMRQGVSEVTTADAESYVAPALARVTSKMDPADFLRSIEESSGLLIKKERGIRAFAHLTFQEYLAADYIRSNGRGAELVDNLDSEWWRETVRMYAAISDATSIVDACLSRKTEPAMLALAVQCADEAQEIANETRSRVEACINPSDARENEVSRHIAAQTRLQLRSHEDAALQKDRFIGRPVTWLEYQYFIDSALDGNLSVPDHCTEVLYPLGMGNQPVAGVRYEDGVKFCAWLGNYLRSGFSYRLPRADEIQIAMNRDGWHQDENVKGFWTATQLASSRDGRFWPLLRLRNRGGRHAPFPSGKGAGRGQLFGVLHADLTWLSRVPPAEREVNHMSADDFAGLEDLVERWWDSDDGCDVGQLATDIHLAEGLVDEYASVFDAGDPNVEMRSRLGALAHRLGELSTVALNRNSYAARSGEALTEKRRLARLTALQAADICAKLHVAHGGSASIPPQERLRRPPNGTAVSNEPVVVMNVLAHVFSAIYAELSLLELRIAGRVPPTEGIMYVRDTGGPQRRTLVGRLARAPVNGRIRTRIWVKSILDAVIASTGLMLMTPLILLTAALILAIDGSPVLFRQTRIGRNGRPFTTYKFRTMVPDAERSEMNGPDADILFTIRSDPRVTRLGRLLRRSGLNDLPLILNVLRGEMAIVGPRPPRPFEVDVYDESAARRFLVKPGVFGLAQVRAGGDPITWKDALAIDLEYVDHISVRLDATIVFRAIGSAIAMRRSTWE